MVISVGTGRRCMVMPIGLALSGIEFIRQVFIDIKELSGGKREGES